eukprot:TRINITY_DN1244_c0_g1_i1.p1 TRINITY_DN1244_c0_g1~~TRINITY_DN1244_c0_g1_i1.p1  ORF type:complete len:331 (+),score=115.51 TRINITY_DN1244_c0_g1_i1:65-994(+)
MGDLSFHEEEAIREALEELRKNDSDMNWVLFGYKNPKCLEMVGAGDGGLEELRGNLGEDQIRFAILEVVVTGDQYNAVKFVLITWIGPEVKAGLAKARCAGHRKELVTLVTQSLAVASEYQPASLEQMTSADISAKLTRVAATYQDSVSVGKPKEDRQVMSRSHANSGDRKLSQLTLKDPDGIEEALRSVYREENNWAVLGYVAGTKDEIELRAVGKGPISELKPHVFPDQVSFCLFSMKVTETTTTVTKFILLTWVGESVKPLTKARSSAHRTDLAEHIITIVPFHSHYPATCEDDLSEDSVKFKLRS